MSSRGLCSFRQRFDFVVVNALRFLIHAVVDDIEKSAGKIGLVAVRQMPAVARFMVSIVSPGWSTAKYTAMLASLPLCG